MEANLWLIPLSLSRLGLWGFKQLKPLSHKYKKSLSPLGKVPHSSIGVFLSTPFLLQTFAFARIQALFLFYFIMFLLLCFQMVLSSSVFGFELSGLGGFTPSYILHTRAFGTYLLGGYFTLQKKIIRYGIFQNKGVMVFYM